eukprot:TRINITY_DN1550_c2_g1_i2.p1 TRINITY_DN1550_c2_g1~~TRINITY_DN1550_c2_g1_i2.p1  ORF type:complete len:353 (+),score=113.73 TRINITY_DN1550_c2_g1_i2:70-1059(+)
MKMTMAMLALPALVMSAVLPANRRQDAANGYFGWQCGHSQVFENNTNPSTEDLKEVQDLHNSNAGIVFLVDGSIDHVRTDAAELAAAGATKQAQYLANDFASLFCYDYISGYKNPNEFGEPGICIRDYTVGNKWEAVLAADVAAKELWNYLGTSYGYQKSVAVQKNKPATNDYATLWGSGASGSNPSNWCGAYMKETACHMAFPQFADVTNSTNLVNNGLGSRVRPVCKDWCNTVLENCNRREPGCYECSQDWINAASERNYSVNMDNSLFCDAWNKGIGMFGETRAGTGVGAGADDENEEFCAMWDASSTLTPMTFAAVVLAVVATLL